MSLVLLIAKSLLGAEKNKKCLQLFITSVLDNFNSFIKNRVTTNFSDLSMPVKNNLSHNVESGSIYFSLSKIAFNDRWNECFEWSIEHKLTQSNDISISLSHDFCVHHLWRNRHTLDQSCTNTRFFFINAHIKLFKLFFTTALWPSKFTKRWGQLIGHHQHTIQHKI